MPFLRKYGILTVTGSTAIRIPLVKRALVDFAVGADFTPVAGDVKINIDGAGPANVTNLPAAVASGNGAYWEFILTAAELTCKQAIVTVVDSATKAVEDQCFIVETFGNASAMYVSDFSAALATPTNITAVASVTGAVGSVTAGVTIASGGIIAGAHAAAELNALADALLDRNMATGTDSGTDSTVVRTVRQALRRLRNKEAIVTGTGTVSKEDDSTPSWTYAATATAGNPLSAIDPS